VSQVRRLIYSSVLSVLSMTRPRTEFGVHIHQAALFEVSESFRQVDKGHLNAFCLPDAGWDGMGYCVVESNLRRAARHCGVVAVWAAVPSLARALRGIFLVVYSRG